MIHRCPTAFVFLFACLSFALVSATLVSAESPIRPCDRIAIVGNTFADQLRIHGYLETLLLQHTRENPVSIRNLGWGGDMLSARDRPTGFPTETETLTAHKTDVILACFGMGESFAGEKGIDDFKTQLQAFIASHAGKKYNGESSVRLILVSPIAYENLGKLTPASNRRNRELQAYTQAMGEVADESNLPFVDLFEPAQYLMGESTGPSLSTNGIHLNSYGYWAISHSFYDQLTASERLISDQSWQLRIDAAAKSSDARGVEISELVLQTTGVSFQATETSAPRLRPPTDQPLPPQLESVRDTLIVSNLKPGKYELSIDQKPIITATAAAWAEGVAVDSSPLHKAVEAYRDVVNDKNLQFTYSWKALNQVHIVGERKKSPSGQSLPKEVIEFEKLASDLDKQLGKAIQFQTRKWKLSRVGL